MLPEAAVRFQVRVQALRRKKKIHEKKKTHARVTVTVVRDRKILTALRTNQIVGFVAVPAWKNMKTHMQ